MVSGILTKFINSTPLQVYSPYRFGEGCKATEKWPLLFLKATHL